MISEVDAWRLEGHRRAARLRVAPDSINEAAAIISTVFGDAWLSTAVKRSPTGFWTTAHPVGGLLMPPGDNQVVGLLELTEYIKAAANSSAFKELVAGLKSSYGSTFLQMALGYRLARIGASDLKYEPPVQDGRKGDIAFTLDGRPLIAECYIPRVKRSSEEVHWLLKQCVELRQGYQPAVASMAVKLKYTPNAAQRKQIVRVMRDLTARLDMDVTAGRRNSYYIETDAAHISVAPTEPALPGECSKGTHDPAFPNVRGTEPFVFARSMVGVGTQPRPGHVPQEIESRDHVAIWLSDDDAEIHSLSQDLTEPLATLGEKLERKLAQTRLNEGTGRLLIVGTWLTRELKRAPDASVGALRRLLLQKHSGVAGILFCLETYSHSHAREFYEYEAFLPDTGGWFTDEHLSRLRALERSLPVPPAVGTGASAV